VLTAAAIALALATGYVRWDPKLPSWWPMWMWSIVFLTALPEEALFRGHAQTWIETWLRRRTASAPRLADTGSAQPTLIAILVAGAVFGVAHLGGGPVYVVLATVAGVGYGWIYASTRSIGAAIAAHAGLNTIHFLFFTYPALLAP
jgi:membrane protease YdiL (CAAX protease family)